MLLMVSVTRAGEDSLPAGVGRKGLVKEQNCKMVCGCRTQQSSWSESLTMSKAVPKAEPVLSGCNPSEVQTAPWKWGAS